jgi:hypothetical protein
MSFLFGGYSKQTLHSSLMAARHRMRIHAEKKKNEIERSKKEVSSLVGRCEREPSEVATFGEFRRSDRNCASSAPLGRCGIESDAHELHQQRVYCAACMKGGFADAHGLRTFRRQAREVSRVPLGPHLRRGNAKGELPSPLTRPSVRL